MEAVKYELERKLKVNFDDVLDDYRTRLGETLELPMPASYSWDFDPAFTIYNKYPVCQILGAKQDVNSTLSLGCRLVADNDIAVAMIMIEQNPTTLDKMKHRYGDALVAFMKKFNSGDYGRDYITMFGPDFSVNYTRATRDEKNAAYVGSVWVFTKARIDTTT